MKPKSLLFALLCYSPIFIFSQQNPQPHFRNYSTEHGLPSPEVYVAFQDSKGYMWFGTDNGASRFDGYHFKNYGAKQGLYSNVVFDIYEDKSGGIWFGTMTGEVFILQGDTIRPYQYNQIVQSYREDYLDAALVHLSKDGTCYFELINLGILKIDNAGQDSLITTDRPSARLVYELENPRKILSTYIRRLYDRTYDEYLTYRLKAQVFNLEVFTEKEVFQKALPLSGEENMIEFKVNKTTSDHLLVFYQQQLFCLSNKDLLWKRPWDYTVNEIVEDRENAFWVCGGGGKGIRRYQDLKALKKDEYKVYLDGLSISSYYIDKQGGIWITSQEKGVFYTSNASLLSYSTNVGFSDDVVTTVTFKNATEIYVGCQNGDIFQLDLQQDQLKGQMKNPWGYHNFDMLYIPELNALWSNGAFWENNKWNFINLQLETTKKKIPFLLHKLDKLQLNTSMELIGCHSFGVFILDVLNKKIIFRPNSSTNRERTFATFNDKEQQLWIGTARGIFQFKDEAFLHSGINHPAFNSRVEDVDEFPDSNLVFGTKGWGVVVWKDKDFAIISEENGLTTNMIEDVHVDENGILWVGTLNGLNKVTFDQKGKPIVRQFTMANGLPSNEIYKIKSYKNQVWLCTAGGLVKFHEQPKNTRANSPILQKIELNGEALAATSPVRFSYQENNFAFDFLTINYRQNGKINYRFRLSKEAKWSYTENLSVNYPALSPGEYHFEVQAQNEDEFWSDSTQYSFEIRPPWWATSWFIGLLGMTFISSGFGLFQYRVTQLKKENLIQQQMTELERSALQAQMNPHFIFNCLNSIQNFILQNDSQKAVEFLSRFARLVRLNLNASVEGNISLEEEVSLLENYLTLEQERFNHCFEYQIEVDEYLLEIDIELPPLLIQPFVENAIVHGLSQKEGKGKVLIKVLQEEDHLLVKIQDNGTGYVPKITTNALPKHKSVGMSITQKRLNLLDSTLPETIKITSLTDDKRNQIGTEISILIKTKYHKTR